MEGQPREQQLTHNRRDTLTFPKLLIKEAETTRVALN